jgi:O-antigen/teichoic acid export membrane protein
VKEWFKYARLRQFDVSTEAGRSDERYRLALWSIAASVFSKGLALLVMLLSVSWTLPYLGAERFGVWMTIASFVGMLIFLDLGIGNALTNHVADAAATADPGSLASRISGGLGLVFIVGVLASSLLSALVAVLPWARIIKVQDPLVQNEIKDALYLFSILFGLSLFNNGVQRVFAGLQRSFEAHLASAIGSLLSILTLSQAAANQAGVAALLLATLGWQSASSLILLYLLIKRGQLQLRGIGAAIHAGKTPLLKTGGLFFVLQIGTMVGWGADSVIVSSTLGAAQVAMYSVVQRLFQLVSVPLAMVNAPLWSAYANADACNDRQFIRTTLKKNIYTTVAAAILGCAILLGAGQMLVVWWTKSAIAVPMSLLAVFAVWTVCESMGNALAMMLNGCGIVREQVVTVVVLTVLALPAKLLFVNLLGVQGMIAVYIFLYCAAVLIFYGFVFRSNLMAKLSES